jgi:formylglycine-generating enzyme required for sulfatase activity
MNISIKYIVILALLICTLRLNANNIQVSNVSIAEDFAAEGYALVECDLSWENSWRTTVAPPANWDAAWVFVKYRISGGEWQHAWLNDNGHNPGSGTASTMEVGLLDDKQAFNPTSNPGIGVMVYRSAIGAGTFSATNMQLRWNYAANGVPPGSQLEVSVYAIEMVLVPGGPFWVGDGESFGSFRQTGSNTAYQVTTTGAALKCGDTSNDDAQMEGAGIWVDGDGGISRSAATQTDMNVDFPTGFRGYYCMKYEISQGQYRDFLNTLTRDQQNARTATDISGTSVTNRYLMTNTVAIQLRNALRCDAALPGSGPIEVYCDLDGDGIKNEMNDGEWIACNWLSWADGAAYLDWCGLRPLTELEYEKLCRGPNLAIAGEYAWGTTAVNSNQYALTGVGTANEQISANYSVSTGNSGHNSTIGPIDGPLRVGIFAANSLNNSRVTSGSGYYGSMELSGNLWERAVTIGTIVGRGYTNLHGDGLLSSDGSTNVHSWPATDAVGFRGGAWSIFLPDMQVSDRNFGAHTGPSRYGNSGFRGCRSVKPSAEGY